MWVFKADATGLEQLKLINQLLWSLHWVKKHLYIQNLGLKIE